MFTGGYCSLSLLGVGIFHSYTKVLDLKYSRKLFEPNVRCSVRASVLPVWIRCLRLDFAISQQLLPMPSIIRPLRGRSGMQNDAFASHWLTIPNCGSGRLIITLLQTCLCHLIKFALVRRNNFNIPARCPHQARYNAWPISQANPIAVHAHLTFICDISMYLGFYSLIFAQGQQQLAVMSTQVRQFWPSALSAMNELKSYTFNSKP